MIAFGAQIDIIRSRFFNDAALCHVFSIRSIWYSAACFSVLGPEILFRAP